MTDTSNYSAENHKRLGVANQISKFSTQTYSEEQTNRGMHPRMTQFSKSKGRPLLTLFYGILNRSQVLQDSANSNATLLACACIFQNTFTLSLNGQCNTCLSHTPNV